MTTYQKRKLKAKTSQLSYKLKNYAKIQAQLVLFLLIAAIIGVAAMEASQAQIYALEPQIIEVEKIVEIEKQVEVIKEVVIEKPVYVTLPTTLPSTSAARREAILLHLKAAGYNESDMQKWGVVLDKETGGLREERKYMNDVQPTTFVKHCKSKASGKWYVREIVKSGSVWIQAHCHAGDIQGRSEKSTGIFQILPSTWERYKCTGDKLNWLDQINCAITLQRKDGFKTHWAYVK